MDFLRILRSLEEFLYEAMTWLIFYPRTMWRAVRHPIQMLHYSNRELSDKPEEQFTDTLSPPLFLMITILLSHMIEVASHNNLSTATTAMGKQIMASEQNLLVLRSILFAIYPLLFAVRRLRRQELPIDRETLRRPFYAQCYIAAPAAFVIGIGTILGRVHATEWQIAGLVLSLAAVVWYLAVEARWLRDQAHISGWRAWRSVIATWLLASILNSIISFIVLGT